MNAAGIWLKQELKTSTVIEQPTQALVSFLLDLKINVALLPKKYGGLEFGLIDEMKLIQHSAEIDPALGFIVFQMCGNTGRIFSYLPEDMIRILLEETRNQIIICYQDNYHIATTDLANNTPMISGMWPIASLSRCATHFALPYTQTRENSCRYCAIVTKEAVQVLDNSIGIGLKSTSSTGYKVNNYPISDNDINVEAISTNIDFLPIYSIPRAPIKHIAWTLGVGNRLLQIRKGIDIKQGNVLINVLNQVRESIIKDIEQIEKRKFNILNCTTLLDNLVHKNRALNSWLMEQTMATYLHFPSISADPQSEISRLICDMLTLSLHASVKEEIPPTWGLERNAQFLRLQEKFQLCSF